MKNIIKVVVLIVAMMVLNVSMYAQRVSSSV